MSRNYLVRIIHFTDKIEVKLAASFALTGGVWICYIVMFYTCTFHALQPYSIQLMLDDAIGSIVWWMDPMLYILMSSELQDALSKTGRLFLKTESPKIFIFQPTSKGSSIFQSSSPKDIKNCTYAPLV